MLAMVMRLLASSGSSSVSPFERVERLLRALQPIEVERALGLRDAVDVRVERHARIDLGRILVLLQPLVEAGQRDQRIGVVLAQSQRETQVDRRDLLAALPPEHRAEAVEDLRGTGARVGDIGCDGAAGGTHRLEVLQQRVAVADAGDVAEQGPDLLLVPEPRQHVRACQHDA